ncbi:lytic transglycosylase domain-containing protein [Streptomyces sp. NPDC014894]|uniref:lytic transglycosylase domain-containing protein n=1 Tax=Streptomyces sp. NPDC014894 TaxID=3364931 RepID=UPI0036FE1106
MAAQFGRRLRKGATTTAVAAVAVAALSASQAPGITAAPLGGGEDNPGRGAPDTQLSPDTSVTGDSPYYTDLPPLRTPDKPGTSVNLPAKGPTESGIPATVLAAYKKAEQTISASDPGCHVPWQLLAAIGKVESGQARGGKVDANGTTHSPILGPALNGVGFANISDTDDGAYDSDTVYDRAVGPMQFIPTTWAAWGQDANGDGEKDPNNIYDAALAAGRYLCAGDRDLRQADDLDRAILGYNQSREYLRTVLSWFEFYKNGTHEVPDGTGSLPGSSTPDSGSDSGSRSQGGGESKAPATPHSPGPSTKPKPPESKKPERPGGSEKPKPTPPPTTTPPTKPPTTPPTTPPEVAPVSRVENAGTGELTAMAGSAFANKITARVKNSLGRGVARQEVRFEIIGGTDTRFEGGRKSVILVTGADGRVTAPVLVAGEKVGAFVVRASAVGKKAPAAEFAAKVTPRAADTLTRTGDEPLTAVAGTEFATGVEIKAAHKGAVASGVGVTATLLKSADSAAANDKGPHFKGADGKPVRALSDLTTDAKGVLKLPKLFADEQTGAFLLRLTAVGGGTVTIELTVTAPVPAETPAG